MRHSVILLLLFLLCGCNQIKLKSLESNKCARCENYLNKLTKLKSNPYPTKALGNLGNLTLTDGANWKSLAKERFEKRQYIDAIDKKDFYKFKENLHCLIGLDRRSVRSLIPNDFNIHKNQTDSTLMVSIMIDVVENKVNSENIWIGTKALRLYFEKKNRTFYLDGSKKEKSNYKKCISE